MLQWLYTYVSSVRSKHLFHTYVISVSSRCCKSRSEMLQAYISSVSGVSYVYCKCLICMLHMFAMATCVFFCCFTRMLQVFRCFGRTLQVFRLDIAKVVWCYTYCNGTHLPQPSAAAAGTPSWVTVRAPEASKRICGAHPQADKVTRTHEQE
jgi:hypothetical protein